MNEQHSPEEVESAAVKQLVILARQFAELQRYTQPDPSDQAWFDACVAGCTEITVTVTMTKSGIASVRLATVDGEGNEEAIRVVDGMAGRPN